MWFFTDPTRTPDSAQIAERLPPGSGVVFRGFGRPGAGHEALRLADIARRIILVVLFDNRTTLGLVRLRMKAAVEELTHTFEGVFSRGGSASPPPPGFLAGAEDEIDRLFQ